MLTKGCPIFNCLHSKKKMRRKDLSTQQRNSLVQFLLINSSNGKPIRGKMKEAAARFSTTRRTVSRLWAAAKKQQEDGQCIQSISGKSTRISPKKVHIDMELIASIELIKRSTIRRLAQGIQCSKSTVARWISQGLLRAHTSAMKPDLTAPNKLLRLRFSLEALELDRAMNILKFKGMHNTVHIDEKWFYISKASHRFYLTPGEAEPYRSCQNKKFITKVMFMCAVSRPIFDSNGGVVFDGKIGIFPLTQRITAQRNSKNRAAGTMITKPIESITKQVIKDCVIQHVFLS